MKLNIQSKEKILSLDLGSSSIGWAIDNIDMEGKHKLYAGVYTFSENVKNLGQGEKEISNNASRRNARVVRRQYRRRKMRKLLLLKRLVAHKMAPEAIQPFLAANDLALLHNQPAYHNWLSLCPYLLRKRGIQEQLTLQELGRVLYHLAQRRGYQSSRKDAGMGGDEDTDTLKYGKKDEFKAGFDDTEDLVLRGGTTLGAALHTLMPTPGESYTSQTTRPRNRYIKREMYEKEFEFLWKHQAKYDPTILTSDLKQELGPPNGIIFYRRPLKVQKHLVGKCTFEPSKKRYPLSSPLFERFRIYSFVHKLKCKDEPLPPIAQEKIADYLLRHPTITLKKIRELADKQDRKEHVFNYSDKEARSDPKPKEATKLAALLDKHVPKDNKAAQSHLFTLLAGFKEDKEARSDYVKRRWNLSDTQAEELNAFTYVEDVKFKEGSDTLRRLADEKIFGTQFFNLSEERQDEIWKALYFAEKDTYIRKIATAWGLPQKHTGNLLAFKAKQGYGHLSKKVLTRLVPLVRQGIPYHQAIPIAGVQRVLGDAWHDFSDTEKEQLIEQVRTICQEVKRARKVHDAQYKQQQHKTPKPPTILENIKPWLREEFSLSEKQMRRLYHHSVIDHAAKEAAGSLELLPVDDESNRDIQNIRNPLVSHSLFQLRKLINSLIKVHGSFDKIHIEVARDLKQGKQKREKVAKEQKANEKANEQARQTLIKLGRGAHPTKEDIVRYKLWQEAGGVCIYSGKPIAVSSLSEGNIEIDHILPRSKTLDNSYTNKVVCYAEENKAKSQKLPRDYMVARGGDEAWQAAKKRALAFWGKTSAKYKKFTKETLDEDFTSRHLNDTRYISCVAKKRLQPICKQIETVPGTLVAKLRKLWGLESLLLKQSKVQSGKIRTDHLHHAIDAIVLSQLNTHRCKELKAYYRKKEEAKEKGISGSKQKIFLDEPWKGFKEELQAIIDGILVVQKKPNSLPLMRRKVKVNKNNTNYINPTLGARGQLHKEGQYYQSKSSATTLGGKAVLHLRKKITDIKTLKQAEAIVDDKVREIVTTHIRNCKTLDKDVSYFAITKGQVEGSKRKTQQITDMQPLLFMPNRQGDRVPIYSVRIKKYAEQTFQAKEGINRHYLTGSNHHAIVYHDQQGKLKGEVVTFT